MPATIAPNRNSIRWYHHLLAIPLKLLSALNLGPFGGENSISAIIEAILAKKKGQEVDFPLSKTEKFFVKMLLSPSAPPLEQLTTYRDLNHRAQKAVIDLWGKKPLGVIWVGGGVFTLDHPLISSSQVNDWHIWTDANPKVIASARAKFDELRQKTALHSGAFNIALPQDIDKLNENIRFLASKKVERIIIQAYGLLYVMTMEENLEWLSKLERPQGIDIAFIVNSMPVHIDGGPAVMAAFHDQRMVYYHRSHVESLFGKYFPGSEIVWSIPGDDTSYGIETWLINVPAPR